MSKKFIGLAASLAIAIISSTSNASLNSQDSGTAAPVKPALPKVACYVGQTLVSGYFNAVYGCRGRWGCGIIDVYWVEPHCAYAD